MFGKEKEEKKKAIGEITGFIGKGTSVEGKLSFEETMRIDGSFKGEISAPGTLVVADTGYIEGDVKVGSAVISGTFKGRLDAEKKVELKAPCRLTGDIKTPTLIIDEGVVFDGACTMVKKDPSSTYELVEYGNSSNTGSEKIAQ